MKGIWNGVGELKKDYIWEKSFKLIRSKYLELQLGHWYNSGNVFNFEINWTRKCDHAGLDFWFNILGYHIIIGIKDNRHWDEDKNMWEGR